MSVGQLFFCILVFENTIYGQDRLSVFYTLDQAKEFFRNISTKLTRDILNDFENKCFETEVLVPAKRQPFIVIEGDNRQGRNVIGMALSNFMQAKYRVQPATCLRKYIHEIPQSTLLRKVFYILSLHALAHEVKYFLAEGRPVILNGYWWDLLLYSMVKARPDGEMPPTSSNMFDIPEQFMRPDAVFYLYRPEKTNFRALTTKTNNDWRLRLRDTYLGLQERGEPIVVLEISGYLSTVVHKMYDIIKANISSNDNILG